MAVNTSQRPGPGGPPSSFGGSFAAAAQAAEDRRVEEAEAAAAEAAGSDPYAGMTPAEKRAAKKAAKNLTGSFSDYATLDSIRPREGYLFRSDYFEVDDGVASILSYFHDEGASEDYGAFWGVNRIPHGLGEGVSVVILEQVRRMGEQWVEDKLKTVENLDRMEEQEQGESGTMRSKRKSAKVASDMHIAAQELADGASYLHVHNRLLVKAPNLEALDSAIEKIDRVYIDRFATLKVEAYPAEQRSELGNLFRKNASKRGKGFHFTSVELAGSHNLVTNGLNDPTGEYVGYMTGDVNTSAVLFDVDKWERRVVVADSSINTALGRAHVPNMWGSKISQAALINNHRVVHIILDDTDLDRMGPPLRGLTARMDLSQGDMNMFELFGSPEQELMLFPQHVEKIKLMAMQAYEATDAERGTIKNALSDILIDFYVDQNMWHRDGKNNRDKLRIVGIPHDQVPLLKVFVTYLDMAYKAELNRSSPDQEMVHAYNALRGTFKSMLDTNGDLFNTLTSDAIDRVDESARVVYDFASLRQRGEGIAMAQLVNVIGYAVSNLGLGDVVVVHGADNVRASVKEYLAGQFEQLVNRGGRVALLYNDVDKMLDDSDFNKFDDADYTILGPMRESTVKKYQKALGQVVPPDLERLLVTKGESLNYLRRGQANVVFRLDLALGVNPARKQRRDAAFAGSASRPSREAGAKAATGTSVTGTSSAERVELTAVAEAKQARRDALTSAGNSGPKKRTAAAPQPPRKTLTSGRGPSGRDLA